MTNHTANPYHIHVGDTVAYRLETGEAIHTVRGKVTRLFNTQNGEILADIQWDWPGPPARVALLNLAKL